MSLIDVIVWYLVFSILTGAVFMWIGGNIRDGSNITQFNKVNELHQYFANTLWGQLRNLEVDKQKDGFQEDMKKEYLKTFKGTPIVLWGEYQDNAVYSCYNAKIDTGSVFLGEKIENLDIDIYKTSYISTDHRGADGSEFLNFLCFYNTRDYLNSSNSIESSSSPIAYVLFTFFEDPQYEKKVVSNKGILYFN
jgi:hypothetical protein